MAQSSLFRLPVRSCMPWMGVSKQRIRFTSCSALISREKMATVLPPRIATWAAMLRAKAVLPMAGRAARRIRSDLFRPVRMASRAENPVDRPI